jgi:hypothetical protein
MAGIINNTNCTLYVLINGKTFPLPPGGTIGAPRNYRDDVDGYWEMGYSCTIERFRKIGDHFSNALGTFVYPIAEGSGGDGEIISDPSSEFGIESDLPDKSSLYTLTLADPPNNSYIVDISGQPPHDPNP